MDSGTLLTAIFTGLTAVATGGIAYGGIKLWKTTEREAEAAGATREILESARLKPKLEISMRDGGEGSSDRATLDIKHLASSESPLIDQLLIEVLNDTANRAADGPVWGPWKLAAGADGADVNGRSAHPREKLGRGRSTLWTFEPTSDPNHLDNSSWRQEQSSRFSLIKLTARIDERSWEYLLEIRPSSPPERP